MSWIITQTNLPTALRILGLLKNLIKKISRPNYYKWRAGWTMGICGEGRTISYKNSKNKYWEKNNKEKINSFSWDTPRDETSLSGEPA